MALFTTDDLAAALQVASVNEDAATLLLRRVTARIEAEIGSVPDPAPALLQSIALDVAVRVYRNPQGMTSETIGDYAYRRDAGGVTLTGDELTLLRRYAPRSRVQSVRLVAYPESV